MFIGSGDYQVPSRLAVDDCSITEAGPAEQIESLCSNVQELDMAKNRVTNWLQVLLLKKIYRKDFKNLDTGIKLLKLS